MDDGRNLLHKEGFLPKETIFNYGGGNFRPTANLGVNFLAGRNQPV
jgi:hypothetical protein